MISFEEYIAQLKFANAAGLDSAAEKLIAHWQQKNDASILHFMYYASLELSRHDERFRESMVLADYILVDGIGMQTYFKWLMGKDIANLNGTDISPYILEKLLHQHIPICFYGTTEEQIQACNDILNDKYDRKVLHYFQNGFTPLDWSKIPDQCVLFVGMGTPLQENWVKENIDIIRQKKLLVMTVGGYFDFLSGFYIRAPKMIRQIKMEWAWRTMLHPGRHYKKRLRDTTIFYRPFVDKQKGVGELIRIVEL